MPSVKVEQSGVRAGSQGSGNRDREIQLGAKLGRFKTSIRFQVSGVNDGRIPELDIFSSSGKIVARLTADRRFGLAAVTMDLQLPIPGTRRHAFGVYVARAEFCRKRLFQKLMLPK